MSAEYDEITKQYYEENSKEYISSTIDANMVDQYQMFEKYLPSSAKILDVGFGSGRDMLYFTKKGYKVKGIDVAEAFVINAKNSGLDVIQGTFEEMPFNNEFDAIWACASLLHSHDLLNSFAQCKKCIKQDGILYASIKYGDYFGIKNSRYFHYINEEGISKIAKVIGFEVLELSITNDVRKDRQNEKWINCVMRKLEGR